MGAWSRVACCGQIKQPAAIVLSKLWCDTLLEALCSRGQSDLRVCKHVLTLESAGAHALPPGRGTQVEEILTEDLNISFTADLNRNRACVQMISLCVVAHMAGRVCVCVCVCAYPTGSDSMLTTAVPVMLI